MRKNKEFNEIDCALDGIVDLNFEHKYIVLRVRRYIEELADAGESSGYESCYLIVTKKHFAFCEDNVSTLNNFLNNLAT